MSYDSKEFKKSLDDYAIGLVPSSFLDPETYAALNGTDQRLLNGLIIRCGVQLLADFIKKWFETNQIEAQVDSWTSTDTPTLGLIRWTCKAGEAKQEDSYLIDGRFWLVRS